MKSKDKQELAQLRLFYSGVKNCLNRLSDSPRSFFDNIKHGVEQTEEVLNKISK